MSFIHIVLWTVNMFYCHSVVKMFRCLKTILNRLDLVNQKHTKSCSIHEQVLYYCMLILCIHSWTWVQISFACVNVFRMTIHLNRVGYLRWPWVHSLQAINSFPGCSGCVLLVHSHFTEPLFYEWRLEAQGLTYRKAARCKHASSVWITPQESRLCVDSVPTHIVQTP